MKALKDFFLLFVCENLISRYENKMMSVKTIDGIKGICMSEKVKNNINVYKLLNCISFMPQTCQTQVNHFLSARKHFHFLMKILKLLLITLVEIFN